MSRKIIPLVLIVLVAAGGLGYQWYTNHRADDPNHVRVSGNIEVTEAQVSFKLAGRVEKRLVDEGQLVQRGQPVAELDMADLTCDLALRKAELRAAEAILAALVAGSRKQEVAAAEAARAKAQAALLALERGSRRQEIAVAEATLASARTDEERLATELARASRLRQQNMISAEQFDQAAASHNVAVARKNEIQARLDLVREGPREEDIEQGRALVAQSTAQFDLVKEGPRKEDIDAARARVEQARAGVALAETRLGYASIGSPLTGVVLSKNIEPGEYVAPGTPVVTVADLKNIWLRAYIPQADLLRVKQGQAARIITGSDGKTYQGRVSFIASEAEFTPKTVQTPQERTKLVYRIKIDIDNPQMELKPGMPADAEIDLLPVAK